jgi:hypothetical protein
VEGSGGRQPHIFWAASGLAIAAFTHQKTLYQDRKENNEETVPHEALDITNVPLEDKVRMSDLRTNISILSACWVCVAKRQRHPTVCLSYIVRLMVTAVYY